jgi:hypothetical protein
MARSRVCGTEKPLLGEGLVVREDHHWVRVWWYDKTAAGRGSGGAKKPKLGKGLVLAERLTVRENYDSIWVVQSEMV